MPPHVSRECHLNTQRGTPLIASYFKLPHDHGLASYTIVDGYTNTFEGVGVTGGRGFPLTTQQAYRILYIQVQAIIIVGLFPRQKKANFAPVLFGKQVLQAGGVGLLQAHVKHGRDEVPVQLLDRVQSNQLESSSVKSEPIVSRRVTREVEVNKPQRQENIGGGGGGGRGRWAFEAIRITSFKTITVCYS